MFKKIVFIILSFLGFQQISSQAKSIHSFKVKGIDGKIIDFSKFKGKKILVVNTASECGFTGQYDDLEKLHKTYGTKLVVVGFPANNFGGQEPGSDTEIATFCKRNYGVTFLLSGKTSVKGNDMTPIFAFLTKKEQNGVKNTVIMWNFTKFLLNEKGELIDTFISTTKPMSDKITKYLK